MKKQSRNLNCCKSDVDDYHKIKIGVPWENIAIGCEYLKNQDSSVVIDKQATRVELLLLEQ